jgi:NAD(P) transhydrogenase subunit alpha
MPLDASVVYSRNVLELFKLMIEEGKLQIDIDDEVIAGSLLTYAGDIKHQPTVEKLQETVQ